MNNIHFQTYEETYPLASKFFNEERNRILEVFPNIQIEHVGGTSVPGSITLGDLDMQVRVSREQFSEVSNTLKTFYNPNYPELWTGEFALFHLKDHPQIPISISLTVIDSPYDNFYKIRDLLRSNPNILKKYNSLKEQYEGKTLKEYKKAKRAFFGSNKNNKLLN